MFSGPSAFSGILVILALIPLNSYLSSNLKILQRLRLKHKDRRIRIMTEILTGIKVKKLVFLYTQLSISQ